MIVTEPDGPWWEYTSVVLNSESPNFDERMNKYGIHHWELVCEKNSRFFFKRQVKRIAK